jgi:hypothetical protein
VSLPREDRKIRTHAADIEYICWRERFHLI